MAKDYLLYQEKKRSLAPLREGTKHQTLPEGAAPMASEWFDFSSFWWMPVY